MKATMLLRSALSTPALHRATVPSTLPSLLSCRPFRTPQHTITQPIFLARVNIKCISTADLYLTIRKQDSKKNRSRVPQKWELPNSYDENERRSFSAGISSGNGEAVNNLMNNNPNLVRQCNPDGTYPIHVAWRTKNIPFVWSLLTRFPDVATQTDCGGRNSFHYAALDGQVEVMDYLLSLPMARSWMNARDFYNDTPLTLAARFDKTEVFQLLSEMNAQG